MPVQVETKKTAQRFNKATAAVISGAVVTIAASVWSLSPEVQGAIATLLTTALVYLVPNK